jgi:hypothetical protein
MRRKELAYPTRCFYCHETDISCFEVDHPVTWKLDPKFKRAVCRNCHWKHERKRDDARLTKNGLHYAPEPERQQLTRYLKLLAMDQDSIADMLESPASSPPLAANALRSTAESMRRKANSLSQPTYPPMSNTALEWDGMGCA